MATIVSLGEMSPRLPDLGVIGYDRDCLLRRTFWDVISVTAQLRSSRRDDGDPQPKPTDFWSNPGYLGCQLLLSTIVIGGRKAVINKQ